SGTTVTITTTNPHAFAVGQSVTVSGVSVGGYNGPFTITSAPDRTHCTSTAAAGLGAASGGTATVPVSNPSFVITAASESATTVTIATANATGFVTGELVTIAGITPGGYNGTFAITVVDGTHF